MIVAMWESATDDQIQESQPSGQDGLCGASHNGARQSVLAAVGKRIDFDIRELEVLPAYRECTASVLPTSW